MSDVVWITARCLERSHFTGRWQFVARDANRRTIAESAPFASGAGMVGYALRERATLAAFVAQLAGDGWVADPTHEREAARAWWHVRLTRDRGEQT